jgi:Kdo2-lipid IVA lauroyltransferase/acyltransferase
VSDCRARRNWQALRPEASDPASVDAAMNRLWRSVSRTMCEFSVLDRLWDAGRITVEGIEHMDAVRAAGKAILVACVHLGNWETIPVVGIRMGHPGSGIYWPLENRFDTRSPSRHANAAARSYFPAMGRARCEPPSRL